MKPVLLVIAVATAATAVAQNPPKMSPTEVYKLDFVLKEMDGIKPVNTRTYQMMASASRGLSSIRAGARVPTSDGAGKGIQYIDVGVNLDIKQLSPTKDGLLLDISAEVSGALDAGTPPRNPPVVRQTRWNSSVEIPLGKPTTVFSSDDPSSKHQLQLEVTATPIH